MLRLRQLQGFLKLTLKIDQAALHLEPRQGGHRFLLHATTAIDSPGGHRFLLHATTAIDSPSRTALRHCRRQILVRNARCALESLEELREEVAREREARAAAHRDARDSHLSAAEGHERAARAEEALVTSMPMDLGAQIATKRRSLKSPTSQRRVVEVDYVASPAAAPSPEEPRNLAERLAAFAAEEFPEAPAPRNLAARYAEAEAAEAEWRAKRCPETLQLYAEHASGHTQWIHEAEDADEHAQGAGPHRDVEQIVAGGRREQQQRREVHHRRSQPIKPIVHPPRLDAKPTARFG